MSPEKIHGVTLIEVTTAMLICIMVCISAPVFSSFWKKQQLHAAITELSTHLAMARSTAIFSHVPVSLCPRASQNSCGNQHEWTKGWLVYLDRDGNQKSHLVDNVLIADSNGGVGSGLRILSSDGRTRVRYGASGRTAGSNTSFYICRDERIAARIIVSLAGRLRTELSTGDMPCPN